MAMTRTVAMDIARATGRQLAPSSQTAFGQITPSQIAAGRRRRFEFVQYVIDGLCFGSHPGASRLAVNGS